MENFFDECHFTLLMFVIAMQQLYAYSY
jgi:hypothetical protein